MQRQHHVVPQRRGTQRRRSDRRLRSRPRLASVAAAWRLGKQAQKIFWDCANGERPLDIFVFEGTVIEGPNGSGRYDMFADRPMKDWVDRLARGSQHRRGHR